jgi:hypothetical protein
MKCWNSSRTRLEYQARHGLTCCSTKIAQSILRQRVFFLQHVQLAATDTGYLPRLYPQRAAFLSLRPVPVLPSRIDPVAARVPRTPAASGYLVNFF